MLEFSVVGHILERQSWSPIVTEGLEHRGTSVVALLERKVGFRACAKNPHPHHDKKYSWDSWVAVD